MAVLVYDSAETVLSVAVTALHENTDDTATILHRPRTRASATW